MKESLSESKNQENEIELVNNDKKFKNITKRPISDLYSVWEWLTTVYNYFDENQKNKYWWQKIGQDKSKGMAHLKYVYEKENLYSVGEVLGKYKDEPFYVALECNVVDLFRRVLKSVKEGAQKAKTGYTKTPYFKRGLDDCIKLVNKKYDELYKYDSKTRKNGELFAHMNLPQNKSELNDLLKRNKY